MVLIGEVLRRPARTSKLQRPRDSDPEHASRRQSQDLPYAFVEQSSDCPH